MLLRKIFKSKSKKKKSTMLEALVVTRDLVLKDQNFHDAFVASAESILKENPEEKDTHKLATMIVDRIFGKNQ